MDTIGQVSSFLEQELEKLEVPMKTANKLQIAMDEIYSNIVRYSGADDAEIKCCVDDGILTLRFRDNGTPYNPLDAETPDTTLSAEERSIGGLGIFMVRKMMDSVDYMYKDGHMASAGVYRQQNSSFPASRRPHPNRMLRSRYHRQTARL